MQVQETKSEGLTRQYAITVTAGEIDDKVNAKLGELAKNVKMPGFRPGKVPLSLVKKQYGRSVIGEVLEQTISETSAKTMTDNDLRPAMQPKVEITAYDEGKDLEYSMTVEVMPEIPQPDLKKVSVERPVVEVSDEMVDEAIKRISEEHKNYEKTDADRPATAEDAILVDFTGKVGGEEFPGGAAQDFVLELSSQNFIPGFVEQLIGVKAGDEKTIQVKFPEEYGSPDVAGKDAEFDVKVKELRERKPVEINDDFAKSLGLDSLAAMKEAVKERLSGEYGQIAKMRVKRALLDRLAEQTDFELPPGLVEQEFAQIWQSISGEAPAGHDDGHDHDHDHDHDHEGHDHGHEGHDHGEQQVDPVAKARFQQHLQESGKTEDELKEEYRTLAGRRVKLGLMLAEFGNANNIKVADEELNRAVVNEARRFPGQERQVIEYYQKNRQALEQLRGPLFEDKVIDYILELADVTDKPMSADELMAEPGDEEEAGDGEAKADGKKKAAKKAPKKKAPAKSKA